jgi:hypothetical protein
LGSLAGIDYTSRRLRIHGIWRQCGAKPIPSDDVRFVNCTFENDGGHIWIDAGDSFLTNFAFENCTFYHPTRPSLLAGKNVGPVLFKNVRIGGAAIRNVDQLRRAGFEVSVPVKFER